MKNSVKKLYNLKHGKGYGMSKYKYYNVIDSFYKGMSTSKGVPYINHINEGINHLENNEICNCICHRQQVLHASNCCYFCESCGQNITVKHYENHLKKCKN